MLGDSLSEFMNGPSAFTATARTAKRAHDGFARPDGPALFNSSVELTYEHQQAPDGASLGLKDIVQFDGGPQDSPGVEPQEAQR